MTETLEILKTLLAQSMPGIDTAAVDMESSLQADLGMGSLETMMTALLIEDHFGFQFEGGLDFETVGDICRYLEDK